MQTGELIIIALLALVVLGPQRLPELARKAGHWAAELRRAAREITAGLESEVGEFKQLGNEIKAASDEMKGPLNEIKAASEEMKAPLDDVRRDISDTSKGLEWKGPKPLSGPTPEDAMRDLERIQGKSVDETAGGEDQAAEADEEPSE
jgi:sec-independent protein translocase protein TatB